MSHDTLCSYRGANATDHVRMSAGRQFVFGTILITLFGLFLRTFLLSSQPVSLDDYGAALTAINYMESGQLGPTMWNHPGLRSILIYCTMQLFGTGVLGLKGISVILGTLCIPLLALVARRVLRHERAALLAAFLWALDPLTIDFSRQAINDIYLAFFPLLGIYLTCRYRESGHQAWLIGAGVSFGLGLASKWSALFPLVITFGFAAAAIWKETRRAGTALAARFVHVSACLVVLPALVYILTFIPWFSRGYGLAEWPSLQQSMYGETSQHTGYQLLEHDRRDHWAYEWFVRPVTFEDIYFTLDKPQAEDPNMASALSFEKNIAVLVAVANPLVWLLVLPATVYTAIRAARGRDEGLWYLTALFLLSYLPLALARRPIWVDTALSVLPYAIMAVAYFVATAFSRARMRRTVVILYITLVVITSVPLYVFVIGKGFEVPILKEYLMKHHVQRVMQLSDGDAPPPGGQVRSECTAQ